MEHYENVILLGPPGVGKIHLAVALGVKAADASHRVLFMPLYRLVATLMKAKLENRLERQLQQLSYSRVLILDEIGYLPMNREEASLFFRLLNRRYEKASIILTSNKGFADWGEMLGRYISHIPAKHFKMVRYYGFLSNRKRASCCRRCIKPWRWR